MVNFPKTHEFYMIPYMVMTIASYNNIFHRVPYKNNMNPYRKLAEFLYVILWKHKAPYYFYQVKDHFFREFNHMLIGKEPKRFFDEERKFLTLRGTHDEQEENTIIKI